MTVGLRPEHLTLGAGEPGMALEMDFAENLGGSSQIHARLPDGSMVVILAPGRPALAQGEALRATLSTDHIYLFDRDGRSV